MKKVISQGIILIVFFIGTWMVLSIIHWTHIFQQNKIANDIPQKLGNIYWQYFKGIDEECLDSVIIQPIDSLVNCICNSNEINKEDITIHVLANNEINAFSLPDGHLVIYTGLLNLVDDEGQLSGVLSHEIAHIERNHVMKKLVKEIGLEALLSNILGTSNSSFILESVKVLSSTAYDRNLEKEADSLAVFYMYKSKLNGFYYAKALSMISNKVSNTINEHNWISTHPETIKRIQQVEHLSKKYCNSGRKILSNRTWSDMKIRLNEFIMETSNHSNGVIPKTKE